MRTKTTIFLAALHAVGCTALNIDLPPVTDAPRHALTQRIR